MTGLDMAQFMIQRAEMGHQGQVYDLFAVVVHQGSLNGGHYTALAKNEGEWYEFNDRYVVKMKESRKIVNSNAYILFYQRRDLVAEAEPVVEQPQAQMP